VRRTVVATVVVALMVGVVAPLIGPARAQAAEPQVVPKVVLVVGPSGAATDRYRAESRAAADLARTFTPDVTEVYAPNATWPAVKDALQGASVVIYMGHGNGWPSIYRDELFGGTQNGFGLNPTAGSGDGTHQYFGESRIAKEVRLAPDAVVLLHHLCYASGLSEPGLPEGTLDQARQRIDNYAAGFIRAGAAAVIAEAYAPPTHLLRSILGSERSIESAWRRAPSRNNNVTSFESARSPGFVALMDARTESSGFERSMVLKSGLASSDVLRGARGSSAATPGRVAPSVPSLTATGLTIGNPMLRGSSVAGTASRLRIGYDVLEDAELPKGLKASVRWTPLDVAPPASDEPAPAAEPTDQPVEPTPPVLSLVVPERPGDVVDPAKVSVTGTAIGFDVTTPASPGRYRLVITLHDASGVAFDARTQALVPAMLVQVTGELDASIIVAGPTEALAGTATTLPLWVANVGREAWGHEATPERAGRPGGPATAARVVGQWLAIDGENDDQRAAAAAATAAATLQPAHEPGSTARVELAMTVPTVAGEYLLVLDVVTPEGDSLVAAGRDPIVVRMTISEPEPPAPRQ
jgi:hypothetical protein